MRGTALYLFEESRRLPRRLSSIVKSSSRHTAGVLLPRALMVIVTRRRTHKSKNYPEKEHNFPKDQDHCAKCGMRAV